MARLEEVLHLYSQPVDKSRPLVCFDEKPVQLLGDVVAPLPIQEGRIARQDYEYERCGTASLLVAFAPQLGKRLVETSPQRTKADYCRFLKRVAEWFPHATEIVLGSDIARLSVIEAELAAMFADIRANALGLPARLAPTLVGLSVGQIQQRVDTAVYELLNAIANYQPGK